MVWNIFLKLDLLRVNANVPRQMGAQLWSKVETGAGWEGREGFRGWGRFLKELKNSCLCTAVGSFLTLY